MARVISRTIESYLFLNIDKIKTDGSIDHAIYSVGDTIEDLRYIENEEIVSVSGKIIEFGVSTVTTRKNYVYTGDDFASRYVITYIILDASKQYESNIVKVECREIVEASGETGVMKIKTYASMTGKLTLALSDNSTKEIPLVAGTFLNNLQCMAGAGKPDVIDTFELVTLICKVTKTTNGSNALGINNIILRKDRTTIELPVAFIIDCEGILEVKEDGADIASAISEGTGVAIGEVTYDGNIELGKEFIIAGNNFGVAANAGPRAFDGILEGETVLSGTVSLVEGAKVTIDGVTFTGNARINVNKAEEVIIKNTRFTGITPDKAKTMMFNLVEDTDSATLIKFENCYFGKNDNADSNAMYHNFELTGFLADGSYIKNCTFKEGTCTQNNINIYNIADAATITISGNIFDYSGNAIRVGTKGDAHCTINIIGNTYYKTDESNNGEYAGLLLIQPYATATTNMSFVKINVDNTKHYDKYPIGYRYYNETGDTPLTDENSPLVKVNKIITKLPLITG